MTNFLWGIKGMPPSNRELDADIAEHIYKWKLCPMPKDINGENAGAALTPNGEMIEGFELPRRGIIHRGYFVQCFSGEWGLALMVAKKVGLDMKVCDVPSTPEALARAALDWHYKRKDMLCDCGVCNSCNGVTPNKPPTQPLYFVCVKCGHPRIPVTMLAPTNSLDGTVSGPGLDFNALVCAECAVK